MSNHLTNVDVVPAELKSGSDATASVEYESDTGGPLQLSSGAGFTVTPSSRTLKATPSAVENVRFTVTRGTATTKSCRVIFTFFESKCEVLVEVT